MRVIFVGSLEFQMNDYVNISNNLKSLVMDLAKKDVEFVIRHSKQESKDKMPIDHLVYEALVEYCKDGTKLSSNSLIIFKEAGVFSDLKVILPHVTHSATTSYRIEFYKELLELVDIVIGVGGEFGLLRLSMLCEWTRKPILLLPGTGGTTDFLWQDFFKKSYQTIYLNHKQKLKIIQTPMINEIDPKYSEKIYELIQIVKEAVNKGFVKSNDFITPDNISISNATSSIRKFSLALWILIISFLISICSLSYYAGNRNHINTEIDVKSKDDNQKMP